ncbi:MAG TPA: GDSL-type esterase/lipase family protein [Pyrinomonadaceae bacterium]|nr:GDSL-type esterase/lipase family protein [Pyrinomonadaceae bacterium]
MTKQKLARLTAAVLVVILLVLPFSSQTDRIIDKVSSRIENPKALQNFLVALAASRSGRLEPVRIMHFGDSHVAADILTREIRQRFQQEFGDGGPGFVVPRNPMATKRVGVESSATDGWVIEGIGGRYASDNIYGPAGISLVTQRPGERAWLQADSNHFEVFLVREPGAGSIEVTINGNDALDQPLNLVASRTSVEFLSFDTADEGLHRIEVRTLAAGRVRLLGLVAERISPGVSYDVFGINGAKANRILNWNQAALAEAISSRNPDLIIIAYGTNEVTEADWTASDYQVELGDILRRLHTMAPDSALLVFAPPDRADLRLNSRLPQLINAERRAALANGAAFWSAYDAMGGAGSMNAWVRQGLAQSDRVHLTTAGYTRLADQFFNDVMRVWREK